jgi:cation diffusion facilitator family transporter
MTPTAMHEPAAIQPHAAKRSAAIFSVLAASVITVLKLITGIVTGSLGMLSESAHSGIDLIASVITLFSVQVSDRPADEDHNYGHGKVESLAAFVETGIMFASCIWLVSEAIHRILFHNHLALRQSFAPFVVLLCSIAVDFSRSRTLGRIAREYRSDALAADSVHFATDMWASLAVMLGLAATFTGERYHLPLLEYADPIAAIVVAGVILRVSWRLAVQTIACHWQRARTFGDSCDPGHGPRRQLNRRNPGCEQCGHASLSGAAYGRACRRFDDSFAARNSHGDDGAPGKAGRSIWNSVHAGSGSHSPTVARSIDAHLLVDSQRK